MSLFAIGDLHLSFYKEKPMDIFGSAWENHAEKIRKNWCSIVKEEDTVILPGDLSWGMNLKEARPDLEFIEALPGRKILLCGNHDYWWDTASKMKEAFPGLYFLYNNYFVYEDTAICGSKGWICPNDTAFTEHDNKLYLREADRFRRSVEEAVKAGYEKIIAVLHYPPTNDKKEQSLFLDVVMRYPQITSVVYGHLHGKESFAAGLLGERQGVCYRLVSADFVDFMPVKLV